MPRFEFSHHENEEAGPNQREGRAKRFRIMLEFVYFFHSIIVFACIAHFLSRFFHLVKEYAYYQGHYPSSVHENIFMASFHFETVPLVITIISIVLIAVFYNLGSYKVFVANNWSWSNAFATLFALLVIFLVGFDGYNLRHKHWLRDPKVLDYGSGMAQSYYNGYLNIIGPSHGDARKSVTERMDQYEATQGVYFPVKRLFIIIPEKFFVPPRLDEHSDEKLQLRSSLEALTIDRAGVKSRSYQNSVYSISKVPDQYDNRTHWYICLEGATPIVTYLESIRQTVNPMMESMKHEIFIKFKQTLETLINGHEETRGKFDLVLYNSDEDLGEVMEHRIHEILDERSLKNRKRK